MPTSFLDAQSQERDPYQLQTPQDASLYSSAAMQSDMLNTANRNPNTVVLGGQVGKTTTGLQYETPIQEQVYYNRAVEDAAKADSDGTVTSAGANSYLDSLSNERSSMTYSTSGQASADLQSSDPNVRLNAERALAQQKEQDITGYQKQAEGTQISSASKSAYISQLPPADPNETMQEKNLRAAVMSGGHAGLSAGQALTSLQTLRDDRLKLDEKTQLLKEQQTSESATEKASQFRMGQTGGSYAASFTAKKDAERSREMRDWNEKVGDFMNSAWDSALTGNLDMAEKFRGEANRAFDQRMQIEDLAMKEREQTMALREYEDTRAANAQTGAMNTIGNLVKAGFTPDKLPQGYLDEMDERAGMPSGFSNNLFGIAQAESEAVAIEAAADAELKQEELKMKRQDSAVKLIGALKDVPLGQSITIDGVEYTGLEKPTPNITTGTETDNQGNTTFWSFNKDTGEVTTTGLGSIGASKDGWTKMQGSDGNWWMVNPNTKQYVPAQPTGAQTSWSGSFPDGSQSPYRSANDPYQGQCAAFCNDMYAEGRLLGNSFSEKKATMGRYEIRESPEDVQPGDTFLMEAGSTGHVGFISAKNHAPDGSIVYTITESNYVPPGGEVISNTRTMRADDKKLKMIVNIPTRTDRLPLAGPDAKDPSRAQKSFETLFPSVATAPSTYEGQKTSLEATRGQDGYVNTDTYKSLRSQQKTDADKKSFDANFSNMLNPKDQTAKAFLGDEQKKEGRNLESGQAKLLAEGQNLNNVLTPVQEILSKDNLFGPVAGRTRAINPYDTEAQDAQARLKRATQVIGSYLEGGVLRKEDEIKYAKMLPQLTDTPDVAKKKLEGVRRLVQDKQREYIGSYKSAGYNVSQFENQSSVDDGKTGVSTEKIRVKRISDGKEYMIDADKFNSNIFIKP
ncbi:MAG: hypothetical protein WC763_05250 [Candidatus Paceibacterota bacterium]|jgi:hypothetical protein